MYEVDSLDTVVELDNVPRPDVGAPLPLVVGDEDHLLLAYIVSEPHPGWDGSYSVAVGPKSGGMPIACIRFHRASAHMFGPPNDEAFFGHPLAARGLRPYAVFEVHDSSWIRKLERMNSVHPRHNKDWYLADRRHFIFAFHDSTFESIAHGFEVVMLRGSMQSALEHLTAVLSESW